jgi:hypothetical protein
MPPALIRTPSYSETREKQAGSAGFSRRQPLSATQSRQRCFQGAAGQFPSCYCRNLRSKSSGGTFSSSKILSSRNTFGPVTTRFVRFQMGDIEPPAMWGGSTTDSRANLSSLCPRDLPRFSTRHTPNSGREHPPHRCTSAFILLSRSTTRFGCASRNSTFGSRICSKARPNPCCMRLLTFFWRSYIASQSTAPRARDTGAMLAVTNSPQKRGSYDNCAGGSTFTPHAGIITIWRKFSTTSIGDSFMV